MMMKMRTRRHRRRCRRLCRALLLLLPTLLSLPITRQLQLTTTITALYLLKSFFENVLH